MNELEFNTLVEDFEFLECWEDKYRYIIELGKKLEVYPDELKTEKYRVIGCASQVWFYPKITTEKDQKIFNFIGDSDAMIVRGLIKILTILFNNKPISELQNIDPHSKLKMLDLQQHMSSQRSNGLKSMIIKIQYIVKYNLLNQS